MRDCVVRPHTLCTIDETLTPGLNLADDSLLRIVPRPTRRSSYSPQPELDVLRQAHRLLDLLHDLGPKGDGILCRSKAGAVIADVLDAFLQRLDLGAESLDAEGVSRDNPWWALCFRSRVKRHSICSALTSQSATVASERPSELSNQRRITASSSVKGSRQVHRLVP